MQNREGIVCLVLAILILSGCSSNVPEGDSSVPVSPSQESSPQASPSFTEAKDAVRDALLKSKSGELSGEAKQAAERLANFVLDNPAATPEQVLQVLEILRQLGVDEPFNEKLIQKLKDYFEDKVKNYKYCKKDILALAETCRALGFDDLSGFAIQEATKAPICTATVTRTYSYKSPDAKIDYLISVDGQLQLRKINGYFNPDYMEFYFANGVITWDYFEQTADTCIVKTRISSGSENIFGYEQGSFGVMPDRSYYGNVVDKKVTFKVEEIKVPPPPGEKDSCPETQTRAYEEEAELEIPIEGTTLDTKHITGEHKIQEDYAKEGIHNSDISKWDLVINYLAGTDLEK